jgi:hypothetical protein
MGATISTRCGEEIKRIELDYLLYYTWLGKNGLHCYNYEAHARISLLIHLIEQNILSVEELNNRLKQEVKW